MENRLKNFGFHEEDPKKPESPQIKLELKPYERLLKLTLEIPDVFGLWDAHLPEQFQGEAFIEHPVYIREREFEAFVKVLHYNRLPYRVETIS